MRIKTPVIFPGLQVIALPIILVILLLVGCTARSGGSTLALDVSLPAGESETEVVEMKLTSSAFEENGMMADKYTYSLGSQCSGENFSPSLAWSQPPEGTSTLLLTMIDPDGGNWVHWLLFNIPPETTSLEEVVGGPQAGTRGRNDFGKLGYGGPCPPSGTHRYVFTLYALDVSLDLEEGAVLKTTLNQNEGHVLAQSSLTGLRSR